MPKSVECFMDREIHLISICDINSLLHGHFLRDEAASYRDFMLYYELSSPIIRYKSKLKKIKTLNTLDFQTQAVFYCSFNR